MESKNIEKNACLLGPSIRQKIAKIMRVEKFTLMIFTIFLLCFFLASQSIPIIDVSVFDNVGSAVFCSKNFYPKVDTEYEIWLARTTCTYIKTCLALNMDIPTLLPIALVLLTTIFRLPKTYFIFMSVSSFSKGYRGYHS